MKIDDELARKLAKLTTAFAKDMEKQRKQVPGPEVPPEEAKKAESEESETLEACGAEWMTGRGLFKVAMQAMQGCLLWDDITWEAQQSFERNAGRLNRAAVFAVLGGKGAPEWPGELNREMRDRLAHAGPLNGEE